jgi:quercetin 2,3-dioxygenase
MLPGGDLLHLYLARGAVEVEMIGRLEQGDSLRVSGLAQLKLSAYAEAEVLVWQMDSEQGDFT